jgi:hypothetical protein
MSIFNELHSHSHSEEGFKQKFNSKFNLIHLISRTSPQFESEWILSRRQTNFLTSQKNHIQTCIIETYNSQMIGMTHM